MNEMLAFKLLRKRSDETLGPLFINKKLVVSPGEWLDAEPHKTKGFTFRPGWHCTSEPSAPHLKEDLKSGEKRVWCQVIIRDYVELKRPNIQGGIWFLAKKMQLLGEIQ